MPDAAQTVRRPDILIVEGLNVRRRRRRPLGVSDFFDFSIYVDARVEDIRQWYIDRLFALRRTAFTDPRSYFHKYAHELDEDETAAFAQRVWRDVNEINLVSNILPTRARATSSCTRTANTPSSASASAASSDQPYSAINCVQRSTTSS